MADSNYGATLLEDGEFWLPPKFLCDEEPYQEEMTIPLKFGGADIGGFSPPAEYGTGWRNSNLSSPGESVVGSAEDSNEEDFITDLTRKVAQATLVDGFPTPSSSKGFYSSGSTKSTLCNGCGCGHSLLWGHPSAAVQWKSPPPPPPQTLDLLYQAVGEVANMRINQQRLQIERLQYLQLQQCLNHLIHLCNSKPEVSTCPYPMSSQQRLQFQPPQASRSCRAKLGKVDTMLSSSAWPTLRQAIQPRQESVSPCVHGHGKGMRAVSLGSNNVCHRGSAGTGVFLPRRARADPEPKRKQQGL